MKNFLFMALLLVSSMVYADETLVPNKILDVGNDVKTVSIMVGTDEDHLVNLVVPRSMVKEGAEAANVDAICYNGRGNMFLNSPKYKAAARLKFNKLDRKKKFAEIEVEARLVNVEQRKFISIPTTRLKITGKQFANLVAKKR
ncbi:MAG: hypothetical protein M0T70_02740 [Geobacteraceae bacterium]|nr:hypothetical protein [Geobacteraceae bacterium]